LRSEKVVKLNGNRLKGGKGDLATVAAHAKLGVMHRRICKMLIKPMKSFAMRTQNVQLSKVMNPPSGTKWLACKRKRLVK